jgi:hypothetical protein
LVINLTFKQIYVISFVFANIYNKNFMKNLILEHLRAFSEGRKQTHTAMNRPDGAGKDFFGFSGNLEKFEFESKLMQSIVDSNRDAFNPKSGEGLYEFQLILGNGGNFRIKGKQNSIGSKRDCGSDSGVKGNTVYFYICANNDTQVDELIIYKSKLFNKDIENVYVTPADMAFVKLMSEPTSQRIRDIIDSASGYDDGKGLEIQKQTMDPKWAYKLDREAKEKERLKNKSQVSMPVDKAELYNRLQNIVKKRLSATKLRDREAIKKFKNQEKELEKELENF